MKRLISCAAAVLLILTAVVALPNIRSRLERRRMIAEQEQIVLPPVQESHLQFSSPMLSSSVSSRPDALNWDVPFSTQAPLLVWDALHEEACEEASVLMVVRYFSGQHIASSDDAERGIQHLVAANAALGYAVDDTAAEVIKLLKSEDSSLSATLLWNPSVDDLQKALSVRSLVIIPAAGRELHNPYFQRPGPLYHMLVLRGYTKDGYVITNDPGTRHGEQYAYRWEVLMNAMHDWNGGDVLHGEKVVIVVRQ